jgi:hypothetical protein
MKGQNILIALSFLLALAHSVCEKSNQPMAGAGFCDTAAVTYTNKVLTIVQNRGDGGIYFWFNLSRSVNLKKKK